MTKRITAKKGGFYKWIISDTIFEVVDIIKEDDKEYVVLKSKIGAPYFNLESKGKISRELFEKLNLERIENENN